MPRFRPAPRPSIVDDEIRSFHAGGVGPRRGAGRSSSAHARRRRPPPAHECHGCGCCLKLPRFGGANHASGPWSSERLRTSRRSPVCGLGVLSGLIARGAVRPAPARRAFYALLLCAAEGLSERAQSHDACSFITRWFGLELCIGVLDAVGVANQLTFQARDPAAPSDSASQRLHCNQTGSTVPPGHPGSVAADAFTRSASVWPAPG